MDNTRAAFAFAANLAKPHFRAYIRDMKDLYGLGDKPVIVAIPIGVTTLQVLEYVVSLPYPDGDPMLIVVMDGDELQGVTPITKDEARARLASPPKPEPKSARKRNWGANVALAVAFVIILAYATVKIVAFMK